MRYAIGFTGFIGSVIPSLLALLMVYFSMTGGFAGRDTVYDAILLALMGGFGLAGTIRSFKNSGGNGVLIFVSALIGIYYFFDVSRAIAIPTILLSVSAVLIFIKNLTARKNRW